jgi:hypothetical protein
MSILSENMARRALAAIFALNAAAAAAAAIVLAVAPGLIPSIAGIAIDRRQNLVPYLLAGRGARYSRACGARHSLRQHRSQKGWASVFSLFSMLARRWQASPRSRKGRALSSP